MSKNFLKELTRKQTEILKSKGIQAVQVAPLEAKELKKKWEGAFAQHLTRVEKDEIYFDEMLWHVFSSEKVGSLEGKEAMEAFNRQKKQRCYLFYQEENNAFILENTSVLAADDIINKNIGTVDVYIVSSNFKWTYVLTHEDDYGPYFSRC